MAGTTKKDAAKRQQPMTAEDKRLMRRRRARRRTVVRAVILVMLCAVLVFLWQNWDWLAPSQLFGQISDWMDGGTGEYPVDLSGTGVRRLCRVEDYTVLLTDSHLIYLDSDGAEMNRYSCAFPTGLVRTAGEYVLLAEQGGQRLHLSTRGDVELELQADREILSVALNEKGQFAVLTNGPQGYLVQVKVYDRKGKVLYTRSRNRTATDVALAADGQELALLSVVAEDGNLNTFVETFFLDSTSAEATYSHAVQDVCLYRLAYYGENRLAAVGDDRALVMDTTNGGVSVYTQEGMRILGYAVGKTQLALVLRPYGDTSNGEVHILNGNTTLLGTVPFTGDFRQLTAGEDGYLLLTDSYVQRLTDQGAGGKATVQADGRETVMDGDRAVVLGLNRLDAYDLE